MVIYIGIDNQGNFVIFDLDTVAHVKHDRNKEWLVNFMLDMGFKPEEFEGYAERDWLMPLEQIDEPFEK